MVLYVVYLYFVPVQCTVYTVHTHRTSNSEVNLLITWSPLEHDRDYLSDTEMPAAFHHCNYRCHQITFNSIFSVKMKCQVQPSSYRRDAVRPVALRLSLRIIDIVKLFLGFLNENCATWRFYFESSFIVATRKDLICHVKSYKWERRREWIDMSCGHRTVLRQDNEDRLMSCV